jgi:hypothetical protein
MAGHMKDHGKTTTCMVRVCTPGATVESTMENISWIKSTAMEFITGPTGGDTKDTGVMANNMVKANTSCLMESQKSVYGTMENELDG